MNIAEYYAATLNKSVREVLDAADFLNGADGYTVLRWDDLALGITKPSDEDLAAILALAEPPPTAAQLVAHANARQWALATGGFAATIAGRSVPFPTTSDGLALMAGKIDRLGKPNPPASVNWQVGPTEFVAIAAADFEAAAIKVADFIQATFDALPAIFAAIQGATPTITTFAEIDAAAWPANAG